MPFAEMSRATHWLFRLLAALLPRRRLSSRRDGSFFFMLDYFAAFKARFGDYCARFFVRSLIPFPA